MKRGRNWIVLKVFQKYYLWQNFVEFNFFGSFLAQDLTENCTALAAKQSKSCELNPVEKHFSRTR